jgi:hypothetical protein
MMKTYLGEDPDSSEAIEFLCLAERGEVSYQSGEAKTFEFTGDMEPVQRTFKRKKENGEEEENKKIMYEYKVLDMQHQDEGIKVWEVSKS